MTAPSTPRIPRGLVLVLLDELGRRGPSEKFWASFRNLAPWLNADEVAFITRRAEHPMPRPSLATLNL